MNLVSLSWSTSPSRGAGIGVRGHRRLTRITLVLAVLLLGANRVDRKGPEGFTEPHQTIQVAAAETGIVQEVRVELGQPVKRGDVLGVLDNDVLRASLEVAQLRRAAGERLPGDWSV